MCFRFLSIVLILCFSCSKERVHCDDHNVAENKEESSHFFISNDGDTIPTGVSLPLKKEFRSSSKSIKPETISIANNRKSLSAHPYIHPAGKPKVVQMATNLKAFVPGSNGLRTPDTLPARILEVPALYSRPHVAAPMQMKDNSVTNIQYLSVEEGLTNNIVQCILEDSRGNLWFGSRDETLTRYDGHSFTFFHNPEDIPDLGFTHLALIEDRNGNIWFGTRTGLGRYDGHHFTYFTNDDSYKYNGVTRLLQDRQGNIWFGTRDRGVGRFDGQSFVHYSTPEGMSHHNVTSLIEDKQGDLWFGTNGGGVTRFDGHSFKHLTTKEGLCHDIINAMLEDEDGQIWFATQGGGACRYNLNEANPAFSSYTMEEGLSSNMVIALCEDRDGQMWFGMYFNAVNLFDGQTFTHFDEKYGMNSTNAGAIIQDSYGNIWVGSNKGIHRFGIPQFRHYTEALSFPINDIAEDNRGNIWFGVSGSWPNGAVRFDEDSLQFYLGSDKDLDFLNAGIHALTTDHLGNIWLGSGNQGVARFDPDKDPDHLFQFDIGVGASNFLISMREDSRGHMWFGTLHGFAHLQGEMLTSYPTRAGPGIEFNFAGPFLEDKEHNMWFGHVQYLGKLQTDENRSALETITYYTKKEGLPHSLVVDIQKDQNDMLWIGTEGGLSKFDGRDFTNITQIDGLVHRKTYSLAIDNLGRIWAGTQNGLSLIIPSTQANDTNEYQIINFGKEDGLKQTDFLYHCALLDSKNRIWWGMSKGVTMLDLNHFRPPDKIPSIQLLYMEVKQQFVDYRRLSDTAYSRSFSFGRALSSAFDSVAPFCNYPLELELPFRLNHLTFHFSGIDWAAPHQLQYSYRLEGFDDAWSLPQAEPKAEYRNLPNGNYLLKVKARGTTRMWSEPVMYSFRILPPWWKTWWAISIYLIIGFSSIFGLYEYQRRRWLLQSQLKIEHEKAERLKELDDFKSRFYTNITHEFRTPLTVIKGVSDQINDNKTKNLIQRNTNRLLNLINQLLDLTKLDNKSLAMHWVNGDIIPYLKFLTESCHSLTEYKKLNLSFFATEKELVMDFDEEKIHYIISNLLSNAIKFTPQYGSIKVVASTKEHVNKPHLQLTVSDTGIGIPEDKLPKIFDRFYQVDDRSNIGVEGSGIGLAIVNEIVELLNGRITVDSCKDKGSVFTILLPIHQKTSLKPKKMDPTIPLEGTAFHPLEKDAEKSKYPGTKPQLLIIEDNPDVTEYLSSFLHPKYSINTARNGKDGIKQALKIIPDIIMSDIMMPEMDGYEVCRLLKTDRRSSHIPIILLTAKATQQDKITGLEYGADAYLTKPFNKDELLVRLENLNKISQRLRERLSDGRETVDFTDQLEKKESAFLSELQNTIKANLENEKFDTHQLCLSMAMSRTQLYRKLKALTGQSTASYIRRIRLRRAKDLLETTDLPIGEIAINVGFKDFSHFSRSFAKEFEMSPSESRK